MLFAKAPMTSLEEDLREFKLMEAEAPSTKTPQVKEPDNKGGDYAGPPQGKDVPQETGYTVDVGDSAAGPRYNVPVRPDTTKAGVAKAEDQQPDGAPIEEMKGSKKLPWFLSKKKQAVEADEQQAAIAEAEAAREELVKRAMDVVESYYGSAESVSEEELRAVIDAYAVVADAYDAALEDVTTRFQATVEANGDYGKEEKKAEPDEKEDEDEEDEDKDEKKPPKGAMESITPTLGRARRLLSEQGGDLKSLVNEIRSLEENLQVESPEAKAVEQHAALIEGFEALRDSCGSICEKILGVIRTEAGVAEGDEIELDGNDDRVKLGAYFESIIDDCEKHLAGLAEGGIDDETAHADLSLMTSDVNKGIEAMKKVSAA